jgi:hypothetical protein
MLTPPTKSSATQISVVAAITAPIPTNVGQASDRELSIIASNVFDVLFADDGTSNIPPALLSTTISPYNLRTVYTFQLGPKNTHFVLAAGNANIRYWLSSRT